MTSSYQNIFSEEDLASFLQLSEVILAKEKIDAKTDGSVYFSIPLTASMKESLSQTFGLDVGQLSSIPMRWIKGDILPHIDKGANDFENTYLVYLTNSPGNLIIEDQTYPITQNTGYSFSEGLYHETKNTGTEPRLLLGPMSEQGFAVGGGFFFNPGTTVYIRQTSVGSSIEYSIDFSTWFGIPWSVTVGNNNPPLGFVKIVFTTDITFDSSIGGQYAYFGCATDGIQFGSTSLKEDGTRPIITIDGITDYPGLIANGSSGANGYNDIRIFNLDIRATNGSTLTTDGGWIGQAYFGKGATNNYIVNCSSNGLIIDAGGGIVGGYASSENGATLYITGCSSSGDSQTYSGGIVGFYAGRNGGVVTCDQCWSIGEISGPNSGGIFGYSAAESGGQVIATKCYSLGSISGINAGGIFGQLAGTSATTVAEKCYSQGAISGTGAGGIYGSGAASDGGTSSAIDCYSSGICTTAGNGIFSGGDGSGRIKTNCYVANGSWNDTDAKIYLLGVPLGSDKVGENWISVVINYPYELNEMGYTPYTIENIVTDISGNPILNQSYSQTVTAGQTSIATIRPGYSYDILGISGGDPSSYNTITMNDNTGVISTIVATVLGTYIITLRNTGSYNITEFILTVLNGVEPCCAQLSTRRGSPLDYATRAELLRGNILLGGARSGNMSYSDIYAMKKAIAASTNNF